MNARDGTLGFSYRDDDTRVVEAPLEEAGLVTKSSTVLVSFQQPVWKSPHTEFTLGGSMEFSFGLPAFGASSQSEFLDTSFFSWQGQVQYAAQLGPNWIFLTRFQGQWTPDSLPVIEQFAVGGMSTVRGYRQNTRSGDRGLVLSAELRSLEWQDGNWGNITPYTFLDFGVIWNNQLPTTYPNTLASVGVGLDWEVEEWFFFRFNYGLRLIEDSTFGSGSFQDEGLNFWLQLQTKF